MRWDLCYLSVITNGIIGHKNYAACKARLWEVEEDQKKFKVILSYKEHSSQSDDRKSCLGVGGAGGIPCGGLQREFQGRSLNHGNPNLVSGF